MIQSKSIFTLSEILILGQFCDFSPELFFLLGEINQIGIAYVRSESDSIYISYVFQFLH